MADTTNLQLPFLEAAQAQKHVTVNEGLLALDTLVQANVIDRDLSAPPVSPSDGDRYIVGSSATGAWEGKDFDIAVWQDGVWKFFDPRAGWLVWAQDEETLLVYDGAAWAVYGGGSGSGVFSGSEASVTPELADKFALLDDSDTSNPKYATGTAMKGLFGDVAGPASSTDGALAQFDGTTGKLLQDGPAYETGSWTPTAGSGVTAIDTMHGAAYERIGNLVVLRALLNVSTDSASEFRIAGLPFSVGNHNAPTAVSMISRSFLSGSTEYTDAFATDNSNECRIQAAETVSDQLLRLTLMYLLNDD